MILIANPIYNSVFKHLMNDLAIAKLLLSALLKKEVVELETCPHDFDTMQISLFRIDFLVKVRESDGLEYLILVKLQKSRLASDSLHATHYLGMPYLQGEGAENWKSEKGEKGSCGLAVVSIYLLDYLFDGLPDPVVYVHRNYLDYENNPVPNAHLFMDVHIPDTVIVQIPLITGHHRNHLEQLLMLFDQAYCQPQTKRYLQVDIEGAADDVKQLFTKLLDAAAMLEVRRGMELEDKMLAEIEEREAVLIRKAKAMEEKEQEGEQNTLLIRSMAKVLHESGLSEHDISKLLYLSVEQVQFYLA